VEGSDIITIKSDADTFCSSYQAATAEQLIHTTKGVASLCHRKFGTAAGAVSCYAGFSTALNNAYDQLNNAYEKKNPLSKPERNTKDCGGDIITHLIYRWIPHKPGSTWSRLARVPLNQIHFLDRFWAGNRVACPPPLWRNDETK
jgi:hypothetical protein